MSLDALKYCVSYDLPQKTLIIVRSEQNTFIWAGL